MAKNTTSAAITSGLDEKNPPDSRGAKSASRRSPGGGSPVAAARSVC